MNKQKESFLQQWEEKFPGVPPPDVDLTNSDTLTKELAKCKEVMKNLESQLNHTKFLLIFLQTCNAASKKSYERKRWGYGSSVESESDATSPHEHHNNSADNSPEEKKSPREDSSNFGKEAGNESVVKPRLKHVTINEGEENKRISKVLENVKMFEGIKENPEDSVTEGKHPLTGLRSQSLRATTNRKRAPYLEVWECKSGGEAGNKINDSAGSRYSGEIGVTDSFTAAAVSMMDPGSKNKLQKSQSVSTDYLPQRTPSSRRDNYVEVWTCSTGDQVSLGVIYDDRMDFIESKYANNPFMVPETEEYGLEDIDVKDGYGKEHYTLAGGEVKLRGNNEHVNEQSSNRLTWPASKANAPEEFQDEHLEDGDSLPLLTASGTLSEGTCDLSDIDHSSGDSSHCDSPTFDHGETESIASGDQVLKVKSDIKSKTFPESASCSSPFHQLRQARTTNERINALDGAADGYYRGFDDEEDDFEWVGSRGSLDSAEYTDDEYQGDDADLAPVTISESVDALMSSRTDSPTFSYKPAESKSISKELRVASLKKQQSSSKDDISTTSSIPSQDGAETSPTHGQHSPPDTVTGMVDYHKVRNIAEAEKLRMRKWVVSSLLDSEENYLEYLNTLLLYMKPLKATISTSMPVMSNQDFETLFYRVPELHSLHADFYEGLTPRLQDWNADTQIGDLFQNLLSKLNYYEDYVNNYKRAQHTAEKCAKENKQFATIIESLKVQSRKTKDSESISLIEILYKPVERVMRNTLVLQDLLKHTPHRHPDYHTLRQVLKHAQHFLNRINTSSSSSRGRKTPSSASQAAARRAQRVLVKDGYLVEVSTEGGNQRKLRHVFLYSDLLLCAKQKSAAGMFHSKESYECKWYIPLADLSFKPSEDSEVGIDVPETSEDDLRDLSNRAIGFKKEIAREKKRLASSRKGQETAIPVSSRQLERFRKKLSEVEAQIVLSAPNLALRIFHMQGKEKIKCYMFLMSSDYERAEWTEAIIKQQESCFKSFSLTSLEVQSLLTSCVKLRKVSNVGSMLIKDDEDLLCGYLTATIHSGKGFLHACNPYCTLEVDSYGHFQTKAKTRLCENTQNPEWNSEFELEVEGTQTLRILCYDRARGSSASYDDDVLIAKGKVGLVQGSLRSHEWVNEVVLMNELEIKISVKFTPREQSLRRLPSQKSNGVFGVSLGTVCKREHSNVPSIVKMCVQEIDKRGMDEIGIYRVSGVASELQELKAYFDGNRKDVSLLLSKVDINAVAGVLKLYFRELPEPLFTNSKYSDFVDAVSLADPETKNNTMTRLLADLPPKNYHTLVYLREHLLRIQENDPVNKMTLHNLATVFGPTLLRPAEDSSKVNTKGSDVMMLCALRMDVHFQMGVLLYCLELPKMPELGASTTGSKLMANAASSENQLGSATIPKSVSGTSLVAKPPRAHNNLYIDPADKSSTAKQVSFATKQGEGNSDNTTRLIKPPKRSSAMPASQLRERYHAYEVVDIVPLSRSPTSTSPPQQLPAVNVQNASNNNSVQINKRISAYAARGVAVLPPRVPPKAAKPVPAPRKPSVKKPQHTTVVTDL